MLVTAASPRISILYWIIMILSMIMYAAIIYQKKKKRCARWG